MQIKPGRSFPRNRTLYEKIISCRHSSLGSIVANAESYKLDESHTTIGFKVKHLVISTVTGRFNKFEGSGSFDDKTKTLKDLKASIQVSSIDTNEADRDKH